jgi:hypothetical protein
MSYNIKGDVKTTGTMIVQGKQPGLNVKLTGNNITYTPETDGVIELPIDLKDSIDNVFDQLPFSQYGALNNNSPGVAGTFDGGSTVSYYAAMPVLLENDGSLVYLRPGTNGSTINYYYTYINNPDSSMRPYTTINKYYEGSWNNILFNDSDTSNCLVYEEVGNNVVHVVLTNGTMDKDLHKSATYTRSLTPYSILTATVAGSYVYIVCLYSSVFNSNFPYNVQYNISDPFEFILYRIPVSEINAGTINTVERVTGINGNTMYGAQGSQPFIRIADAWASTIGTSSNSFIKYNSVFSNISPYTYSMPGMAKCIFDGTNININFSTNMFCTNETNRYDTYYSFVTKYNISTNTFTTDLSNTPITSIGGNTGAITYTNPYSITSQNLYGFDNAFSDSLHGTIYITSNGTQYYIREKYVLSDNYNVYSGKIASFTNKVDAYNFRNRTFNNPSVYIVSSDYASRVGDQLMGGIPIDTSKIIFSGTGTYEGIPYTKYKKGVSEIGTTRTYNYNSFTSGTMTGYAPQIDRVPLMPNTYGGVSYCDASGNVSFYGTLFIENDILSCGYKLNPSTLTYDRTITVSNQLLTNIKNSIISSLGLSVSASLAGLYFSPDTSYFNSILCISTVNTSGLGGNQIIASVNVTLTGDAITAISLNTIINNYVNNDITTVTGNGKFTSEMVRHGGMCVAVYSDFTYVSLPHAINVTVPGDSQEYSYAGVKSGSTLTSLKQSNSYHAPDLYPTAREYSYIPNYGFGFYMFEKTDRGTKLVFDYRGKTLAEFQNNMPAGNDASIGTSTPTVILAQDVVQGFYLYFTEVTPVLMNGKFFEMPITSIDLSTIKSNPGNTKFYVYVDSSSGTPQYKVSLTEIPESLTNMYIGNIQTDGTKVSDLNISKVSRFGIYRPSETQIGSAFPVSTGNPAQTGTINW